jgi:hypothetical protein
VITCIAIKLLVQSTLLLILAVALKTVLIIIKSRKSSMNDRLEMQEEGDSVADAVAAIVLIVVFVAACVFWVSTQ